jgi:hypothetical protein
MYRSAQKKDELYFSIGEKHKVMNCFIRISVKNIPFRNKFVEKMLIFLPYKY